MLSLPTEISSFNDFLNKFDMFYFCYGSIQPGFCLEVAHSYHWQFTKGYSEEQLNADILANKNLFDWKESNEFYYPNTNMFSGDNSQIGISGYVVRKWRM